MSCIGGTRYADGARLDAAERARRERVRLAVAEMIEAGASAQPVDRETVPGLEIAGEPVAAGTNSQEALVSKARTGAKCKLTEVQVAELEAVGYDGFIWTHLATP